MVNPSEAPQLAYIMDDDPDRHAQIDELALDVLNSEIPGFAILANVSDEDIEEMATNLTAAKPKKPVGVIETHLRHQALVLGASTRLSTGVDKKINHVRMNPNRPQKMLLQPPSKFIPGKLPIPKKGEAYPNRSVLTLNTALRSAATGVFLASIEPDSFDRQKASDILRDGEDKMTTLLPKLASLVIKSRTSSGLVTAYWQEGRSKDPVLDSQVTDFDFYWK